MYYTSLKTETTNSMRLQGIGLVEGSPAVNIKVGDVLMWNFGEKENVVEILQETKKQVKIKIEYKGKYYERKLLKTRLVCILKHKA